MLKSRVDLLPAVYRNQLLLLLYRYIIMCNEKHDCQNCHIRYIHLALPRNCCVLLFKHVTEITAEFLFNVGQSIVSRLTAISLLTAAKLSYSNLIHVEKSPKLLYILSTQQKSHLVVVTILHLFQQRIFCNLKNLVTSCACL